MNLIDRYVAEVGLRLPETSRADIEKEIRSTLEDMLEDRSQKADRPVDEAMTVEVLKEFGHPQEVASSYLPKRYLIGPQLYPYFIMVMKLSLLVAFIVALVRLSIGIAQAEPTIDAIIQNIIQSMLGSGGIVISILGNVVLVFAIIEWARPNIKEEISFEWDPRSLPERVEKSERVSPASAIAEMVFTTAAILIFNFYPEILGVGFLADGKWTFFPVLSEAFFRYLPWLNILWALEITQHAILLSQGRWQPATRWFAIVIQIFNIGLLYALLHGPMLFNLTAESLRSAGISDPASAEGLVSLVSACVNLGLIVAIIVLTIQMAIAVYKALTNNKPINIPMIEYMKKGKS